MKFFAAIVSILFSINAHAEFFPKNFKFVRLAPVSIHSIEALCPTTDGSVNCVADGTVITLKTLVRCGERLGDVNAQAIEVDGELHVFAAAALLQPVAANTECGAPTEVLTKVTFINQFGDVKLHNLNKNSAVKTFQTKTLLPLKGLETL
ncbi:MAG TPA: hypothetical protein VM432_08950 [Bdellovibrionales bacterium]|nr:hypothetical protein [Bdellovibrionales bacterium]